MNGLNKRRKATSVSTFDFATLYNKLPHNKLLIVLNRLIDFCFDGGECKYIYQQTANKGCSRLSTS